MTNLEEILRNKKIIIIIIGIIILVGIGTFLYFSQKQYKNIDSIDMLEEIDKDIYENSTNTEIQTDANEEVLDNNNISEEVSKEKIAIHITGEVKKTGLLYLNKGARIADAIEEAGGATKDASLDQVNLAYVLEDGQKIYIPNKKEKIETGAYIIKNSGDNVLIEEGNTSNAINTKGENEKVNINSANQTELETLPGIGPSLAQRIIEYRETNGDFKKIEDIQNVKGIGDSKYSNIKDNICI